MNKTVLPFFFSVCFVFTCLPIQQANADYSPRIDGQHFDFELPRIDNRKPVKLSDFRGKKVLLLHFASW